MTPAGATFIEHRFRPAAPVDVRRTLGFSTRFPTSVVRPDGVWRATRTPTGPATIRLQSLATDVRVQAWGPGAAWAVEHAPEAVGADQSTDALVARHPMVDDLARRSPGLRIPRTRAVFEALLPTIL